MIPGVIPSDDVGAIRASVMHTTAVHRNPNAPPTIGHVPGLIKHDQSFAPYLASRKVMDVVEAIFGTHAKITFTTGQTNHPGCERQEWHSDWPFNQSGNAHLRAPYVNATIHLTALYMLDEMTAENGTILLPGTHRAKVNPSVPGVHDPSSPHPREQRATGTAGSVLILDSRLWHCILPNPTNASACRLRRALRAVVVSRRTRAARPPCPHASCLLALRLTPLCPSTCAGGSFDTSVVMPGSAARKRVVEGAGRPTTSASHAGIPPGDPCQPRPAPRL